MLLVVVVIVIVVAVVLAVSFGHGGSHRAQKSRTKLSNPVVRSGVVVEESNGNCVVRNLNATGSVVLNGPSQGVVELSDYGTAVGVTGDDGCPTAVIDHWAQYQFQQCEPGHQPATWAMLWQGSTWIGWDSITDITSRIQVPPPPEGALGVKNFFQIWGGGMQPDGAPMTCYKDNPQYGTKAQLNCTRNHKRGFFKDSCYFQGDNATTVYNSGHFHRIITGSAFEPLQGTFNGVKSPPSASGSTKWLMTSNVEMGGTLGFGYGTHVEAGEMVTTRMREGERTGWITSMAADKTDATLSLAWTEQLWDRVFQEKAVRLGVIDAHDNQSELFNEDDWKWALIPYEMSTVKTQPASVEDIPKMWPSSPTIYKDVVVHVENGGGFSQPVRFDTGLEVTGALFDWELFTNYTALKVFVDSYDRRNEKFPFLSCYTQCIFARYNGYAKTENLDGSYDFEIKFQAEAENGDGGYDFKMKFVDGVPEQCRNSYWRKFCSHEHNKVFSWCSEYPSGV